MSYQPKPKADGLRRYGRYDKKEDLARCCVSVANGPWDSKQCTNKRVLGEFCRQHEPGLVEERRKKRPPTRFQVEMAMARERAEFEKRVARVLVEMRDRLATHVPRTVSSEWDEVVESLRKRGWLQKEEPS